MNDVEWYNRYKYFHTNLVLRSEDGSKTHIIFYKNKGNKKGLTPYRENCQNILLMTVPIMRRLRRLGIKCKFMYYTMYIPTYL